jgi:hypothetical protein
MVQRILRLSGSLIRPSFRYLRTPRFNGIIFTPAATNPYFIIVNPDITLTLSGTGVTNNSGITQHFFLSSGDFAGGMRFTHSATAADARIVMGQATIITFLNRSSAGSSTISSAEIDTSVNFFNSSTAANTHMDFTGGVFNSVTFHDHSTAGGATLELGENGSVTFFDHSSAGNATIITLGNPFRAVEFFDSSTAGNATIQGNGGRIVSPALRFRPQREPSARHRTAAIPAKTRRRVTMLS